MLGSSYLLGWYKKDLLFNLCAQAMSVSLLQFAYCDVAGFLCSKLGCMLEFGELNIWGALALNCVVVHSLSEGSVGKQSYPK